MSDSPEAYRDTVQALAEYFSTRFQFYGRKIKLVEFFDGEGSGASELLGGGKEKALADAVQAAEGDRRLRRHQRHHASPTPTRSPSRRS